MSEIKKGDRIEVRYTAVVEKLRSNRNPDLLLVRRESDGKFVYAHRDYATVIEPAYEVGQVYDSATGTSYYRLSRSNGDTSWRDVRSGVVRHHDFPVRPLRKLVPESQPDPWISERS